MERAGAMMTRHAISRPSIMRRAVSVARTICQTSPQQEKQLLRRSAAFLALLIAAAGLTGCSGGLGCNDAPVREALDRALDRLYAPSRQFAKVAVRIDDIITIERSARRTSCRAVMNVSVEAMLMKKQQEDTTVEYIAETTEQGRVLVTLTSPP